MFDFSYIKPNVKQVIADLENEPFQMTHSQLYTPINELFMKLNDTNADSTTPNYNWFIQSVKHLPITTETKTETNHTDNLQFTCVNHNGSEKTVDGFIKYSPLLDPIRYLVGKYDISDNNLKSMPLYNQQNSHPKIHETDNASYVDSFFSYLSSKLLHEHKFLNAIDCYGNVLGLKKVLTMDVVDDMEYLMDSDFFIKNNSVLYDMDNEFHAQILNRDSRSKKVALKFDNTDNDENNANFEVDNLESLEELNIAFEDNIQELENTDCIEITDLTDAEISIPSKRNRTDGTSSTCSSNCSSRTSLTCDSDDEEGDNDGEGSDDNNNDGSEDGSENGSGDEGDDSDMETDSTASEDKALVNIYNFPVNAIFLEKCENTLDYLCSEDEDFDSEELCAALMQVIMSLIAFDKCFELQHNDLHTNNIMYIPTEKQFLYYKVNNTHYKVPTYGRIFKIIDFGRATYKFRGNQLCSDSFHKEGDAHTQFNFSKHYNSSRPVLKPNGSFDLCRLATSLLDFLIEDMEELETTKDPVIHMVADWCKDDNGRNILWKSNGDERYPGFKLYKMIARTVSKHKPILQLERPILEKYKCNRKSIKKSTNLMNIDELPCYTGIL